MKIEGHENCCCNTCCNAKDPCKCTGCNECGVSNYEKPCMTCSPFYIYKEELELPDDLPAYNLSIIKWYTKYCIAKKMIPNFMQEIELRYQENNLLKDEIKVLKCEVKRLRKEVERLKK